MSQHKSLLTGAELTICLVLSIVIGLSGAIHNPGAGIGWRAGYVFGTFLGILVIYLAIKRLWRMLIYVVQRMSGTQPSAREEKLSQTAKAVKVGGSDVA
jgi:hypothetical protein